MNHTTHRAFVGRCVDFEHLVKVNPRPSIIFQKSLEATKMKHFKSFVFKVLIKICELSFIFGQHVPDVVSKSNNQITVAASIRKPFVVYDEAKQELKGSDVQMMEVFAKKYNVSVKFVKLDIKLSEILNENEQFNGLFKNSTLL